MPETTASEVISIEGVIDKIIFSSEETHFTVASLRRLEDNRRFTIVGAILGANEGERVRVAGTLQKHPKYGVQLHVDHFEVLLPTDVDAIEKYLWSAIKGIGPSLAAAMVKLFGSETLEVLDKNPDRLMEVSGIGRKKLQQILRSWQSQRENHQTMLFLAKYGIRGMRAAKIYRQYGGNTVAILREHPYRLATDIDGIGFLTADRIAREVGLPEDDPERIQAGIFHCLQEATGQGHCFLPQQELLQAVSQLLKIPADKGQEILDRAVAAKLYYRAEAANNAIYLNYLYAAEYHVASFIKQYLNLPVSHSVVRTEQTLTRVQEEMGITFLDSQNHAIRQALSQKICILTGGPGVGKTTIIKALVQILTRHSNVALAAPTGRAAKRLSETTQFPASTIHRLLRYNPHQRSFEHDHKHPLKVDHIVIDETSMMDIPLAYYLLRAIPPSASITFVGDIDQLPSVGPGNFLKDLIESRLIPVVKLTHIFRQAQGSSIVEVAHKINGGVIPRIPARPPSDIIFLPMEDSEAGAATIVEMVTKTLPQEHRFHPFHEIQVLTPMYRGDVGADNLNRLLAQALNPDGKHIGREQFRVGDKVMQTSNDYEKDIYNGDIGIIKGADTDEKTVTVEFYQRSVTFQESELDTLVRAYAITIHKSQGSEYPAVVIPIFTEHYIMLQRNLLYTAITRGKSCVVLLGNQRALAIAIRNFKARNRYTNLANMLQTQ